MKTYLSPGLQCPLKNTLLCRAFTSKHTYIIKRVRLSSGCRSAAVTTSIFQAEVLCIRSLRYCVLLIQQIDSLVDDIFINVVLVFHLIPAKVCCCYTLKRFYSNF